MAEEVVRARRFELVDHEDNVRAKLEADVSAEHEGPVGLTIFDARGEERVRLLVGADDSIEFSCIDAQGEVRALIMLFDDGTPGLAMGDSNGTVRVDLRLAGEERLPTLALKDSRGSARAVLTISDQEGYNEPGTLLLGDAARNDQASLIAVGKTPESRAFIEITDESGETVRTL